MSDLKVNFGDFDAITIYVESVSNAGRHWFEQTFGPGAVSATLRKSYYGELIARASTAELSVETV